MTTTRIPKPKPSRYRVIRRADGVWCIICPLDLGSHHPFVSFPGWSGQCQCSTEETFAAAIARAFDLATPTEATA